MQWIGRTLESKGFNVVLNSVKELWELKQWGLFEENAAKLREAVVKLFLKKLLDIVDTDVSKTEKIKR